MARLELEAIKAELEAQAGEVPAGDGSGHDGARADGSTPADEGAKHEGEAGA